MAAEISKTNFVTEALAGEIRAGKFRPGEKLPSTRQLSERFQVSTMVLHQASRRLEEMGLIRSSSRAGLFIPETRKQKMLCGFITSVVMGMMENYYESFIRVCGDSNCVPMTVGARIDDIESMLEKQPVRVYVDLSWKDLTFSSVGHLLEGFDPVYCNRFEYVNERPDSGVLTDWIWVTEQTLRHFLAAGHKRILFVSHELEMREYKKIEMIEAAKRVGLVFESPEFQWCGHRDFTEYPERIRQIFRKDPPTAVFSRGDGPLYQFMDALSIFFPNSAAMEKIGCYDTFWARHPGREFPSWHWNWESLWKMAFSHKDGLEFYHPELDIIKQKE